MIKLNILVGLVVLLIRGHDTHEHHNHHHHDHSNAYPIKTHSDQIKNEKVC